jgi:hypothetical protein
MLRRHRILTVFLMIVLALAPACGDEDDNSMNPGGPSLAGTWEADTFSAGGTDYVPTGLSVTLTLTATTYVLDVTGDTNNVICEMTTDCVDSGTLSFTSTVLTFDPDDPEAVTLNYTVTDTTLTLTGSIEGTALSATFTRT